LYIMKKMRVTIPKGKLAVSMVSLIRERLTIRNEECNDSSKTIIGLSSLDEILDATAGDAEKETCHKVGLLDHRNEISLKKILVKAQTPNEVLEVISDTILAVEKGLSPSPLSPLNLETAIYRIARLALDEFSAQSISNMAWALPKIGGESRYRPEMVKVDAQLRSKIAVMSSASSAVTYTSVYTDSEPGRVFWGADDEEVSEGGISRVIDEDEREPRFIQASDPDFVPEPVYPEYMPLKDEHVFPAEEQPLPHVDSVTAESPGYISESDPEKDPEEYEDEEAEDGPVDYPMDGGDDGDNGGDSSGDDVDDEDEDEEDEEDEEEEEHLAPVDSAIVIPTDEPISSPEETEPVIPPSSTDISTIGARITVRLQASISFLPEPEVERLLAMTTLSPSPPISLSPPSAGEHLASSIASTQALIDAVTAALPSPSLPLLPPSLYIPPPVDHRDEIPKSEQPPHKRLCLSTLGSRYEIGESSTARPTRGRGTDYGFFSTVDAEERMTLQETIWIVEEEAHASREAWAHSIRLSQATHQELQTHRDHVSETRFQMQQAEIAALRESDCRRQTQMAETLRVLRDMRREMGDMQAELLAHREQQRRARQP
ncbi:hypothetical protein Tco_0514279, partial [Tanacetum coccineum]